MNSTDLVRLIERDGRQLVAGLYGELKTNLGTSYYRVLGEDEFFERVTPCINVWPNGWFQRMTRTSGVSPSTEAGCGFMMEFRWVRLFLL